MANRLLGVLLITTLIIGLLPGLSIAQESQCFSPVADSYTLKSQPTTNFGGEDKLRVLWLDANADRAQIYLRFDVSPIPTDAQILSADLSLYQQSAGVSASFSLSRVTGSWTEFGLNWNNGPTSTGNFDNPTHSATSGMKKWNAIQPVADWVSGNSSNFGLKISSGLLDAPTDFVSSEGTYNRRPTLCIEWEVGVVTDLVVTDMEVTQSVQDLNNSVRLVAGKRTFVRLHARATDRSFRTFAQLAITCDNFGRTLFPINNRNGYVVVAKNPSRLVLNHSFLFELPSDCVDEAESISIMGHINPVTDSRGAYPQESNILNNVIGPLFFDFEEVPPLDLIVYATDYSDGGVDYRTEDAEIWWLRSWLLRAYPISDLTLERRRFTWGDIDVNARSTFIDPVSGDVNKKLRKFRKTDKKNGGDKRTIYYAILNDDGGFMRGSASNPAGSGPAGPTSPTSSMTSWDTDDTYGDWYGGHEIGHTLKRSHVNCNGSEAGPDSNYPHAGGLISNTTTGKSALFGFDSAWEPSVYGPVWSDIMSYCAFQWISDYTYHNIMNFIQGEFDGAALNAVQSAGPQQRYLVVGSIEGTQALISPVFLYPDVAQPEPSVPGDYAIVLLNKVNQQLSRHEFTPQIDTSGRSLENDVSPGGFRYLLIDEWVDYVPGTATIVIEGPTGELARIDPGATTPNVQITSPNGGQILSAANINVQWTSSDADDDQLWFSLEFSHNNGLSWTTVETDVSGNSATISRDSLKSTGGANGLFRVWATDGVHTAFDESDQAFSVTSKAPTLTIISPVDQQVVAVKQTLNLQAQAYSDLAGAMGGDQVRWVSTIDGLIGVGEQVSVTGLSVGEHTVVVAANDGTRTSVDNVKFIVVESPSELPQTVFGLSVEPRVAVFQPTLGINSFEIYVDSAGGTNLMNWSAFKTAPWLSLDRSSGTTSGVITATINTTGLAPGDYSTNILVLTPDIPGGGSKTVRAHFSIPVKPDVFEDSFEIP
jgi:hypothetical protein